MLFVDTRNTYIAVALPSDRLNLATGDCHVEMNAVELAPLRIYCTKVFHCSASEGSAWMCTGIMLGCTMHVMVYAKRLATVFSH